MPEEQLVEKVRSLPDSPGVYLMKDAVERVIYVGKARSLRQRVRSYFVEDPQASPKLKALQARIRDLDYVVTDTEVEALILECTLIKEHRPRYNVNLRDDKDYPYLRITDECYPRLEYLRLSQKEGRRGRKKVVGRKEWQPQGQFFGPYTSAAAVKSTMRLLGKIFPMRRCRQSLTGEPTGQRPCLNYQMKRCLAPCRGVEAVPLQEYNSLVEQVTLFLEGRQSELERGLQRRMVEAAQQERFEEAARLRDQLLALKQVAEGRQKVLSVEQAGDQDVLTLVRQDKEAAVQLFVIREGKLCNQEHFPLTGASDASDSEALSSFLKSYYSRGITPPAEILLSHALDSEEMPLLLEWLGSAAGKKVKLWSPRRGFRRRMVELAARNGELRLQEDIQRSYQREQLPLQELAQLTSLDREPERIEGYDISHLRGSEAVGSMVVFFQGRSYKDGYRHFHLRQTPKGDDYAALQEVLGRRARRKEWPLPDLMLIDGGKGQLNAAREALDRAGLTHQRIISLAKNPEQIFLEGVSAPVILPANSPLLQMLQRIRDEAHRFALDYHRRLRRHSESRSLLEKVPGIGPKRRAALLNHFGSMEELMRAPEKEIAKVPGCDREIARRLFDHLHQR